MLQRPNLMSWWETRNTLNSELWQNWIFGSPIRPSTRGTLNSSVFWVIKWCKLARNDVPGLRIGPIFKGYSLTLEDPTYVPETSVSNHLIRRNNSENGKILFDRKRHIVALDCADRTILRQGTAITTDVRLLNCRKSLIKKHCLHHTDKCAVPFTVARATKTYARQTHTITLPPYDTLTTLYVIVHPLPSNPTTP